MKINFKQTGAGTKRTEFYFDESGQDTGGELFIVAGVAVKDSDALRERCISLESTSGKGRAKWAEAKRTKRLAYLRAAVSDVSSFGGTVFYSVFRKTTDYDGATVEGIARAYHKLSIPDSLVFVYVDALGNKKGHNYKTRLRKLGCSVKKVRGKKDENEPLIRLADAVAGAAAELLKYDSEDLGEIFSQAKQQGTLVEL